MSRATKRVFNLARLAVTWTTMSTLAGFLSGASAKDSRPLETALKLCTAFLVQPDRLESVLTEAGFKPQPSKNISTNWTVAGFENSGATLIVTELKFTDVTSKSCQYNESSAVSKEQLQAFVKTLAANAEIGPIEAELGVVPMGSNKTLMMASLHRTGNNPIINGSITASDNFLTMSLSRMTMKAN